MIVQSAYDILARLEPNSNQKFTLIIIIDDFLLIVSLAVHVSSKTLLYTFACAEHFQLVVCQRLTSCRCLLERGKRKLFYSS